MDDDEGNGRSGQYLLLGVIALTVILAGLGPVLSAVGANPTSAGVLIIGIGAAGILAVAFLLTRGKKKD